MDVNLDTLEHNWTAEVRLNNGVKETIWWTAWPMSRHIVNEVLSVSSDYPRRLIKESETYKWQR